MTPLIRDMSKLMPEPETAHWFDLGTVDNHVPASRVEWDKVRHMPYPRTACVFRTAETGTKYAVALMAGESHITLFYVAQDPGKPPLYSKPVQVLEVNGELGYRVDGKEPKDTEAVKRVVRVLVVVAQRIHAERTAYQATRQGTTAQQAKRQRHGKAPLFDWHTVTIAPAATAPTGLGGHHASPRLHDRRGHWRKYPSGKVGWVKNCKVGDASKGVVFKDYKVAQ